MKQRPEEIISEDEDLEFEILFTFETEEGVTLALCQDVTNGDVEELDEANLYLFGYSEKEGDGIELFEIDDVMYEKYKDDMFSYANDYFEGDDVLLEDDDDDDDDDDEIFDYLNLAHGIAQSELDNDEDEEGDDDVCPECKEHGCKDPNHHHNNK
jgi:hypothetical protein